MLLWFAIANIRQLYVDSGGERTVFDGFEKLVSLQTNRRPHKTLK